MRPLDEESEKGCCCLPGKCAGVVSARDMRGADVKRVCSFASGVNGGEPDGDSITQLETCQGALLNHV